MNGRLDLGRRENALEASRASTRMARAPILDPRDRNLGRFLWKHISRFVEDLRSARRRQAAYQELMALDDRNLTDIGISRSDIRAIVIGTFTRDESSKSAGARASGRRFDTRRPHHP